jgi:hypothetical protein
MLDDLKRFSLNDIKILEKSFKAYIEDNPLLSREDSVKYERKNSDLNKSVAQALAKIEIFLKEYKYNRETSKWIDTSKKQNRGLLQNWPKWLLNSSFIRNKKTFEANPIASIH